MSSSDYLSGCVFLRNLARGDVWYARVRVGVKDTKKRIGPAWTKRSTCPPGYFTKASAERWLREWLIEVQRGQRIEQQATGATWEDACREWLRWTEHDRKRKRSTVRDYRLTVEANLIGDLGADRSWRRSRRRASSATAMRCWPRTACRRAQSISG